MRIGRRPSGGVSITEMSLQAGKAHLEGARDRRRRHREDVDAQLELAQELLLLHAEPLLLVDDEEAEVLGADVAREEAVRADQDVHAAFGESP